jgi:hypothetical protein
LFRCCCDLSNLLVFNLFVFFVFSYSLIEHVAGFYLVGQNLPLTQKLLLPLDLFLPL